jgi:hypothetical protein
MSPAYRGSAHCRLREHVVWSFCCSGNRTKYLNEVMRSVASHENIDLIDWERGPLEPHSHAPWSSLLVDFVHPTEEAGIEMVQTVLRHFGVSTSTSSDKKSGGNL